MSKKLVVFYSWSGYTGKVAAYICERTGAVLLELQVNEDEYPRTYQQCVSRVAKHGKGYEPALVNPLPNLTVYDTVFVGSPCWWGTISGPLRSFLHQNDLSGKTIAPFMTHGTSGLRLLEIETLCPDSRITRGLGIFNSYQVSNRENSVSNLGNYKALVDAWLEQLEVEIWLSGNGR